MPKASSRPSLPTSSADFALPTSSSAAASTSSFTLDEQNLLPQRFRRPSSLTSKSVYHSESRLHSPLAASFSLHSRRRSHTLLMMEESESDKERMLTDSPSGSSENSTPPLRAAGGEKEQLEKSVASKPPTTPPRKSSTGTDDQESHFPSPKLARRLSFPLKQPRILTLLAESRPEENEVQSEAAFQRLITSCSELPRTPRSITDRGRYPEEAGEEEIQREDTPSDDEGNVEDTPFAFHANGGSEPMNIQKPCTPADSVNGDESSICASESSSFGFASMDVDTAPASPSLSSVMSSVNHWRYTPPPTASAVRSNKRKFDDRFDPYPSASKRRAVSPSMSLLRDAHPIGSPINARNARLPISIPINIPGSAVSSAASSPTIGTSFSSPFPRSVSMSSSPTLRASMGLASPILRPVPRTGVGIRRGDGEEKEIEGAGEAVGGLTLS